MGKYVCTGCDYVFEGDNLCGCPYCGCDSIKKEKTAEELLDEIEEILEE
jgi:rRNA maturation endonuclease Nob1